MKAQTITNVKMDGTNSQAELIRQMAAIARKPDSVVKVNLDKERTLLIDLNTMEVFESIVGEGVTFNGSWRHVKAMVWAGLLDEDPTLTLKQAGKLVPFKEFVQISKALAQVFELPNPLAVVPPKSKDGHSGDTA